MTQGFCCLHFTGACAGVASVFAANLGRRGVRGPGGAARGAVGAFARGRGRTGVAATPTARLGPGTKQLAAPHELSMGAGTGVAATGSISQ